jgi:branched-chain amino acid transport system permease protein
MSDAATTASDMPKEQPGSSARFYSIWLIAAIALIVLPLIFSSGGSLTSFSLIGIAIVFALS